MVMEKRRLARSDSKDYQESEERGELMKDTNKGATTDIKQLIINLYLVLKSNHRMYIIVHLF